ncbi:MAG: aspartate kinase [Alphaproteobacteria bacterium]|jgi:aspartate kinase|nr:aspartate kinase [Alphaproteobacteria bacterium]
MARIVQKFGGSSVANLDRIMHVAHLVKREVDAGNEVAVVVSAMAGVTNQLVELVQKVSPFYDLREHDVVVSSGEQITAGLLSLVLQSMGIQARSWLAWQLPVLTDESHSKARIQLIRADLLKEELSNNKVAVLTGFQGITEDKRITTLGRGGSDTSAVALAAVLKADFCDIYTDVDGIYTADPNIVSKARKIDKITFEEMLEFASQGAKVLQTNSVEMAMRHNVRVRVRSSFSDVPGTWVVDESEILDHAPVSGIAHSRDEAKITLVDLIDHPSSFEKIFTPLSEAHINVDMIVKNISTSAGKIDLTFTVSKGDLERTLYVLEQRLTENVFDKINFDPDVAKVSVIGLGMKSHAGIASTMFKTLSEKGIPIYVISTSEVKISVLIAEEYLELAVRALHAAYNLDAH